MQHWHSIKFWLSCKHPVNSLTFTNGNTLWKFLPLETKMEQVPSTKHALYVQDLQGQYSFNRPASCKLKIVERRKQHITKSPGLNHFHKVEIRKKWFFFVFCFFTNQWRQKSGRTTDIITKSWSLKNKMDNAIFLSHTHRHKERQTKLD